MEDREFTSNGNSEAPHISSSSRPRGDSPPAQSRMTRDTPPGRIYVGNLPNSADRKTVEDLFSKYGRIVDISVKRTISGTSFAFVEYSDPRDAQDAIRDRDGADVDGSLLRVETPFATRGPPPNRGGGFNARGPFPPRGGPSVGGRRGEFRLSVVGLPTSGSWQDLKDHMREAGECVFADVYRDGTGVVEFARADDMEYALRHFQDSKFRSHEGETGHITLTRDESRAFQGGAGGGGGGGYRDDRPPRSTHRYSSAPYPSNGGGQYGSRPGGNYGGGDRYGDARDSGPSSRGGYAPYRGGGGPPSGGYPDASRGGDRGSYGPSKGARRSPSYSRRSRSRSRSFQRYR